MAQHRFPELDSPLIRMRLVTYLQHAPPSRLFNLRGALCAVESDPDEEPTETFWWFPNGAVQS